MPIINKETEEFAMRASLHPNFEAGMDAILNVMKYRGTKPYGVMIIGDPGCGKSFLLETVQRKHPELFTRRRTEVPMVCIDSPPEIATSAFYSDLLEGLGDKCADEGTPKALRRRVKKLLKNLNTQVIGIDEAHDFLPSSGLSSTSKAVKTIKWLMNNTKVPLVLAGKPNTKDLLDIDDQLESRFVQVIKLENFSCVNEERSLDSADFFDGLFSVFPRNVIGMSFLGEVEGIKTDEPEYQLNDNYENLLRFILATSGNPRLINMLLMDVIESTKKGGTLNISDFAPSWDKVLKSKMKMNINPFISPLKLVYEEAEIRGLYEK